MGFDAILTSVLIPLEISPDTNLTAEWKVRQEYLVFPTAEGNNVFTCLSVFLCC